MSLKEILDQLRSDLEHSNINVDTQFKKLQEKIYREISASQEVLKRELIEKTRSSTHASSLRPTGPYFSPHAGAGLAEGPLPPAASVVSLDSPAGPAQ